MEKIAGVLFVAAGFFGCYRQIHIEKNLPITTD